MQADFAKYLGMLTLLIFVYLVVYYDRGAQGIVGALSKANTNTILALQGRNPATF